MPISDRTRRLVVPLVAFALVLGVDVLWVARSAAASIPYWRMDAVALSLLAAAVIVALGGWRRRWITAAAAGGLGVAIFRWGAAAVAAWAPLASGTPLAVHDTTRDPVPDLLRLNLAGLFEGAQGAIVPRSATRL